VVDFQHIETNTQDNQDQIRRLSPGCFAFDGVPGLLFFPKALSEVEQKEWVEKALNKYSCSPPHPNNRTNLDSSVTTGPYCAKTNPLRWATLGFSYDWSNKIYDPTRYSPFPEQLREMILRVVKTVGEAAEKDALSTAGAESEAGANDDAVKDHIANSKASVLCTSYEPQTAIVNYFPVGTMMCAHQDLSEPSLHRPLISISLGCSAVFLMGTTSRQDRPHAFILRSGDIVSFAGESRLAFHGVPRILDDCPAYLLPSENNGQPEDDDRIKNLRVNINVRQVYDEPQECVRELRRPNP
jgi:alkylated DNA repair protein alkB family protein 1